MQNTSTTSQSKLLKAVEALIAKATQTKAKPRLQKISEDKLFEVMLLAKLLRRYKRVHPNAFVKHIPPSNTKQKSITNKSQIVIAGGPASRNKTKFSYFELLENKFVIAEAWVSLEVISLSWERAGSKYPVPLAGMHELDVAIVDPGSSKHPYYNEIQVAASCKNQHLATKEQVREALGLRRETAYASHPNGSRAPWLKNNVCADPPSPLLLVSSDAGIKKYYKPVDSFGLFVKYLNFH